MSGREYCKSLPVRQRGLISSAKVAKVVKKLLCGRAPGVDDVCPGFLKALDVVRLSWLTRLCNITCTGGGGRAAGLADRAGGPSFSSCRTPLSGTRFCEGWTPDPRYTVEDGWTDGTGFQVTVCQSKPTCTKLYQTEVFCILSGLPLKPLIWGLQPT